MKLGIFPTLTKTYILERISQEQIFEYYLGVPVVLNKLITSPLRNDDNPTCGFAYNSQGRLRFRDFSGHFWGDCFDVVAYYLKIESRDKKGFQLIIHTIAKDFRIHKYQDIKEVNKYNTITKDFFSTKKIKEKITFKIIPRDYNYHDYDYWNKFNIDRNLLNHGLVYAAEEVWLSKDGQDFTRIYKYSTKDPAYCYFGGKGTYNIEDWKIYYPYRRKGEQRFHTNSSFLQGKHLISGGKVGIITKAYKDVLSFRSFGLQAVAPSAESVLLSREDFEFMQDNFDHIISCMDYDRTGQRMAKLLRDTYDIRPIMFTNGSFGSKNYGAKDFAEYVNNNGVLVTKRLITQIYKNNIPNN